MDPMLQKLMGNASNRRGSVVSMRSIGKMSNNSSHASSKKFLFNKIKNSSINNSSFASKHRKSTLHNLEIEYNKYIEQFQGMFVVKCQNMNQELKQILQDHKLEDLIKEFPNFSRL